MPICAQSYFSDPSGNYRLRFLADRAQFLMEKCVSGAWLAQYRFSLKASHLCDFYDNLKISKSGPHHEKRRQIKCIKPTATGHLSIKNDQFIINQKDDVIATKIISPGDLPAILKNAFKMDADFVDRYFCFD